MKVMQEQTHYNTSPEQGWSQMNAILDQEMPVQKRSRRMIFIWWSFAALLMVGLTGTLAYQQGWMHKAFQPMPLIETTPPQQQHQDNIQQEPIASESGNDFAANSSSNQSAILNNDNSAVSADAKSTQSKSRQPKTTESTSTKSTSTKSNTTNKASQGNKSLGTENNLTSATAESESFNAQTPITQTEEIAINTTDQYNEEVLTNIQVLHSDPQDKGVTESVPVLEMGYFTIPEAELATVQVSEFTSPGKKQVKINPGIEGNVLAGFHNGAGLYAGATADVKLAKRLSLTTGLGYRTFDPSAELFSLAESDLAAAPYNNSIIKNDPQFDGFYVVGESINNASYQDLDPVIESVHQWQAQAGLDWRFSGKFSLEGGLGIAFHTRAYSEYPIVPVSYINSAVSKTSNSLEGYDVVRETMTSCFAGLTYHIGRHLAIKAQWMHTFQPYLNTEQKSNALASFKQREDYIRGITLGMKYSIL